MSKRLKIILVSLAGALVVVVGGGLAFWFLYWKSDAPPEVSLAGAIGSITTPTASPSASGSGATPTPSASVAATGQPGGPGGSGSPGARPSPGPGGPGGGGGDFGVQAAPSVPAPSLPTFGGGALASGVAGTWAPDPTQQSFVGYRVQEELRVIGSNTVVGRTPGVTGQAVLTDSSVTSAKFVADVTKLKSDNDLRDGQLRNQAIEFSKFPTATFELSGPVSLPTDLASGKPISVTAKGKFTLHGVTRDVTLPIQAQVVGGRLVVVGSFQINFADYEVGKPRGGPVLSVGDTAIVEIQLILSRS